MEHIDVYYSPKLISRPDTFSPSPAKPALVVADWREHGFAIRLIEPIPVTREQIALAHAGDFVDGVLDCVLQNGFGGYQKDVAESLPWTSGSLLYAARGALANGTVSCSPTSGFHHAGYAHNSGFCTFNGLMITALALKAEGKVARVGILDCDQHYGDGTDDIIKSLGIDWIRHVTAGKGYKRSARTFLARLPDLVRGFADCDIVLYQAGADPHVNDPLGGFLTTDQLAERDRIVFAAANKLGVPVVWNLAGGYQEPVAEVLEVHRNTMAACAAEYVIAMPGGKRCPSTPANTK